MKTQEKVKHIYKANLRRIDVDNHLSAISCRDVAEAEFVARACNSFEALLEACKTVSYGLRTGASERPLKNILDKAIQQAESEG